jgi:hypothetical protein
MLYFDFKCSDPSCIHVQTFNIHCSKLTTYQNFNALFNYPEHLLLKSVD